MNIKHKGHLVCIHEAHFKVFKLNKTKTMQHRMFAKMPAQVGHIFIPVIKSKFI